MEFESDIRSMNRKPLISDKERSICHYIRYFLNRTQEIFKWSGFPESVSCKWMEYYLQMTGHALIAEKNGALYALSGSLSGDLDEYYMPRKYTVSNPYLNLNRQFTIGEDCAIVYNDALVGGLYPIVRRYAEMLAECDITLRTSVIMSRATALITASNATEKQSAQEFITQLEDGKISIIATSPVFEGVKAQPLQTSAHNGITDIVEARQYCLAGFYNEIGLNANFNMKRESINANETALNRDALFPLIDDMARERQEACERINAMFGLSVSVELSSAWKLNREEAQAETDEQEETEPDGGKKDVQEADVS